MQQYVTSRKVRARYGVSAMTLWRWMRDGRFPRPVVICKRNYFDIAELDAFDAARKADPPDIVKPATPAVGSSRSNGLKSNQTRHPLNSESDLPSQALHNHEGGER